MSQTRRARDISLGLYLCITRAARTFDTRVNVSYARTQESATILVSDIYDPGAMTRNEVLADMSLNAIAVAPNGQQLVFRNKPGDSNDRVSFMWLTPVALEPPLAMPGMDSIRVTVNGYGHTCVVSAS